jgi:ABC-type thiamin/hydroxymethylpyrimidine transport system permease subunit
MNKSTLFLGAVVIAVIAIVVAIYYMVPGVYHVLATHDINSAQPKHAIAFGAIAVIAILAALINRPKTSVR